MTEPRRPAAALAVAAGLLGVAACAPSDTPDGGTSVLASFYPLVFVAEEVGGPDVEVQSLTPAGSDPHSLELSPAQIMQLEQADLVVYSSGLQAAVDHAIADQPPSAAVDAMAATDLTDAGGGGDPHFWLDPTLLAPVATEVAEQLGSADPDHAEQYTARAEQLVSELDQLDQRYADGLSACRDAVLITSHEAFGYLADRYGLHQEGIAGIDPEVEPSPARVREVAGLVSDHGVRTLYFETIASPRVTEQLAAELDVDTAVLDPLESPPAEGDYLSAMAANLDALTSGLTCAG